MSSYEISLGNVNNCIYERIKVDLPKGQPGTDNDAEAPDGNFELHNFLLRYRELSPHFD
jgi:hypothetical protein